MTENEMTGWHHRLNGMGLSKLWEFDIQGCLPGYSPLGRRVGHD